MTTSYDLPNEPTANQTVRLALELLADCVHATEDEKRAAQDLLDSPDWTVYFP